MMLQMIAQILEIWAPGSGGPIVSQATARTRVGIVTFDMNANIIAALDKINSNVELIIALRGLNQTTSTTVDGSK